MEKRLALKNDTILELEETVKGQNTEILKLQDEILSWKIHASRSDDALLSTNNIQAPGLEEKASRSRNNNERDGQDKKQNKENLEDTNEAKHNMDNKAKAFRERQEPEYTIDLTADTEKTTKVVLVGTSNLKYISQQYLSDKTVKVEKVINFLSILLLKDRNI